MDTESHTGLEIKTNCTDRCYELIISIVMMKLRVLGLGERCAGQGHLDRDTGFWLNINC